LDLGRIFISHVILEKFSGTSGIQFLFLTWRNPLVSTFVLQVYHIASPAPDPRHFNPTLV
jgi:hypothetical protein